MARLLMVLVVLAAVVAAVGFYRGWFHLTSDSASDTANVTLTVDKDKIQEDRKDAQEKVEALGHQVKDKAAAPAEKSKNP
jgi:hypothetical protein